MSSKLNLELKRTFTFEEILPIASQALLGMQKRESFQVHNYKATEENFSAEIEVQPRKMAEGEGYYVNAYIACEVIKSLCVLHAGGPIYLKDFELNPYQPIGKTRFSSTMTLERTLGKDLVYRFSLAEGAFSGLAVVQKMNFENSTSSNDQTYIGESFQFSEVNVDGPQIYFEAQVCSREIYEDKTCLNKSLILEMIGQLGIIHGHLLLGLEKKTANVWAGKIKLSSTDPLFDPKSIRMELKIKNHRNAQSDPRVFAVDYEVCVNGGALSADVRMYFDPPKLETSSQNEVNWEQERKHFLITQKHAYFMNAAITPFRIEIAKAFRQETNLMMSAGGIGDKRFYGIIENARRSCARVIGTQPLNLAFLPNASFGMNILAMTALQKTEKREVLLPADEFPATILPWKHHGFRPRLISSWHGFLPVEKILSEITNETAAVVTSAIQFGNGYRQDLQRLGHELAQRGILFFVNATQALGVFPIHFDKYQVTGMTASCHKGLGAGLGLSLFATSEKYWRSVKWPIVGWRSVTNPWDLELENPEYRHDPSALELGGMPIAGLAGVHAAAECVLRIGIDRISERILNLANELVTKLSRNSFELATYRANTSSSQSGIFGIEVDDPNYYQRELIKQGVHLTTRRGQLRVAVHYYNSTADIDRLVTALNAIRTNREVQGAIA